MKIQLSDHFSTGRLLRFALPIAEALALVVTVQFLIRKRHVYHYA